jgi:hypothetical protein
VHGGGFAVQVNELIQAADDIDVGAQTYLDAAAILGSVTGIDTAFVGGEPFGADCCRASLVDMLQLVTGILADGGESLALNASALRRSIFTYLRADRFAPGDVGRANVSPYVAMPDPTDFSRLIDTVDLALPRLARQGSGWAAADGVTDAPSYLPSQALDGMGDLEGTLRNWEGEAAERFRINFARHFDTISLSQFQLLLVVDAALRGQRAVWRSARADVLRLARTTRVLVTWVDNRAQADAAYRLTMLTCLALVPVGLFMGVPAAGAAGAATASRQAAIVWDSEPRRRVSPAGTPRTRGQFRPGRSGAPASATSSCP